MANIKGITIEIEGKTSSLEKSLQSVNKIANSAQKELNEINKSLKFNPGNTELVAQKQSVLAKQIENTKTKLQQLKNVQDQVEQQKNDGNISAERYRAFQREIVQTESKLKEYQNALSNVGSDQERLATNTDRLEKVFVLTKSSVDDYADVLGSRLTNSIKNGTASADDLERAFNKIAKEALGSKTDISDLKKSLDKLDDTNSVDELRKDFESLNTTVDTTDEKVGKISSAITAGNLMKGAEIVASSGQKIKEFATGSIDAFRTVDESLDIVKTKTGASGEALESMHGIVKDIAGQMPEEFIEIGNAVGEVNTQFGLVDEQLQSTAEYMLKYANINGTDVTTSTIVAKQALEAYKLTVEDLPSALDTVSYVSQQTGVSVDTLMQKAVDGAPQIKALGLSFEEGVNLMGKFEQAGVDSSATLSSLSKAAVTYAKDGKTLNEGLKETIEQIKNTSSETEALNIATSVFGSKAAPRMVDAIKRGALNFEDLSEAAKNSSGVVSSTFEDTLDPIDKFTTAQNEIKTAMAEVGNEIAEAAEPLIDTFIPMIKELAKWFSDLPGPVQTFIVAIGAVAVALSALLPLFSAIAMGAAASGMAILPFLASLLPVAGIIAGIIAAVGAVILIFQNWDTITKVLGATWDWIKGVAVAAWGSVTQTVSNMASNAGSYISNLGTSIKGTWDSIISKTKEIWDSVKKTITDSIDNAKNAVKKAIDAIKGFLKFKWEWPKIPLPHFSFSGSMNPMDWVNPGKRPKIGVQWYAKGGILQSPTAFGMNGNNIMIGGEAGKEAVLPLNRETLGGIGEGIAKTMNSGNVSAMLEIIIRLLEQLLDKDTDIYFDGEVISKKQFPILKSIEKQTESRISRMRGVGNFG